MSERTIEYAPIKTGDDLYIIACLETRRCKIGRSSAVYQRLERLQAGSPTRLVIYAHAPKLGDIESVLHEVFAEGRLHGEWFNPEVTAQIAAKVKFKNAASFVRFIDAMRARWRVSEARKVREAKRAWREKTRSPL